MRRRRDERGAFLVLWAVLVTGMMVMLAIVIDLGAIRANRRALQSAADVSLLAGGVTFVTPGGLDPMAACQDAVRYLNQNLPDLPASIDASGFCNQSGRELDKTYCNPPFSRPQATPSTTAGPYTVELHYPVPDSEIADASGVRSNDGAPCERIRLLLTRKDKSFFAGMVGVSTLNSNASATIRRMPVNSSLIPALWLLDPTGCVSLNVNGSGTTVTVGTQGSDTVAPIPGVVTIDSDGSTCNNNQYTLTSSGQLVAYPLTGTGYDRGMVSLYALPAGRTTCVAPACNPSEVPSNIQPQPVRRDKRATRAPIDWRFDCKKNYPAYSVPSNPLYKVPIPDCPNADTTEPYITRLRSPVNGVGSVPGVMPSGYTRYTGSCSPSGTMPAGNLWIACPTFSVKNLVEFPGQNVVFDGDVSITAGGQLRFNHSNPAATATCLATVCPLESSEQGAFIFMRNGNLSVTGGGSFDFHHTFIYEAGGVLNAGGNGSPVWDAPTAGPFRGLAYWNEFASSSYQISGGAAMSLGGVFFTPQAAPFNIAGGSPAVQQNAQFVSRQAKISGGGTLRLTPNQSDAVELPPPAAVLIR
jgi:hypothetical protein